LHHTTNRETLSQWASSTCMIWKPAVAGRLPLSGGNALFMGIFRD